jgi:hypothetical protein
MKNDTLYPIDIFLEIIIYYHGSLVEARGRIKPESRNAFPAKGAELWALAEPVLPVK